MRKPSIKPDSMPRAGAKWRHFEQKALEIRRFAGAAPAERLDPQGLAEIINLRVVSLSAIEGLSDQAREHLRSSGQWSGAATEMLPDGSRIIIINDGQSPARQAATLMEEICHTLLGHQPSSIRTGDDAGRSYKRQIEEEAYGVGAAALVPYQALAEMLIAGKTVRTIAGHFGVTPSLVEYRMKVLGLWKRDI